MKQALARYSMVAFKFAALPLLFLAAAAVVQTNHIPNAEACRDCPFPMLVAPQHWRMPGGYSDVTVEERNLGHRRMQSVVRLIETATGQLLAFGHLDHPKGLKRLTVKLKDITGGELEAKLTYDSVDRSKVKIKITCQTCSLGSAFLQ